MMTKQVLCLMKQVCLNMVLLQKKFESFIFFATQLQIEQKKWDALVVSADDIKAIDGITANTNILPSNAGNPTFPRNPYTLQGESGITVSLVAGSRVNNDATGSYSYEASLSKKNFNRKTVRVTYFFATQLQIAQRKWNALTFTAAHIKAIDGITASTNILASSAGDPTFPRNPYTLQGETGITIRVVTRSRVNDDAKGSLSYRVNLDKPNRNRKTIQVTYGEGSFYTKAKWTVSLFLLTT